MSYCNELLLLVIVYLFFPSIKSESGCQTNCNQVWYDGTPRKYQIFYTYEGVSLNAEVSSANWKWVSNNTEWTVYYKEWPQKGLTIGGFLVSKMHIIAAKLSWKVRNNILQYMTVYRTPLEGKWNLNLCNNDLPIKFEAKNRSWIFYLGEIKLVGGKSGRLKLHMKSFLLNTNRTELRSRKTREIDGMNDEDKKTVWNKIKGWFKELFDQSEEDDRGWVTRLSDWMLGFLQRVLS